jgi:predicted HicB family RNase H-like nuclease
MPLKKAKAASKAPRSQRQSSAPSAAQPARKRSAATKSPGETSPTAKKNDLPAVKPLSLFTYDQRVTKVLAIARALFAARIDWPSYFAEVLGLSGAIERLFLDEDEKETFRASEEHAEIQDYLNQLVRHGPATGEEPSRVITVRLPGSLHASLKTEAHRREMSLNDLCINRLVLGDSRPTKRAKVAKSQIAE